jgi:hypothetical protein
LNEIPRIATQSAIEPMATGGFAAWMKRRGKLGGQHKVPRIVNDAALLGELRAFGATSAPSPAARP